MADRMAEWQKEWQNDQMAGMATYVLFMVHTDTDTDTTLIFYSIELVYYYVLGAHLQWWMPFRPPLPPADKL